MIKIKLIKKSVDTKQWVKWLNDKEITKFSEQRLKKHTVKSQKKFLLGKIKAENSKLFQIFYKNQFVGLVELGFIDRFHKICEVMYFLGNKNYWGKKIATTANGEIIYIFFRDILSSISKSGTFAAVIKIGAAATEIIIEVKRNRSNFIGFETPKRS